MSIIESVRSFRFRSVLFFLAGFLGTLAYTLAFAWYPPPILVLEFTLLLLPLLALVVGENRLVLVWINLWAGVVTSVVAVWVASPGSSFNMWPIDLVVILGGTGLPLLVGTAVVFLVQRLFLHSGSSRGDSSSRP